MAKEYDKEALLLDWRAKTYRTIDLLAHAYKISPTRVKQLIKGVDQDLAEIVTKKVELNQMISSKTNEEVTFIEKNVTFRERLLRQVQSFGDKALIKAAVLLEDETTGTGFKAIIDGVDKLTVTNGLNPRFATTAQVEINNTNAAQANITAHDASVEARIRARHHGRMG